MPPVKELHFFDRNPTYPTPSFLATSSLRSRLKRCWQNREMPRDTDKFFTLVRKGKFRKAAWWWWWIFGTYNSKWYAKQFAPGKFFKAVGEITPSYSILTSQDVAKVQTINPDLKLIFIIRNPIERAWSAIRLYKQTNPDFDINSDAKIISLLQERGNLLRSDYERTIDTFLQHFNPDQLLVCFYDAIQNAPGRLMDDITHFLGIAPFKEGAIVNSVQINSAPSRPMSRRVRAYLHELYTPSIESMADRFGSYAINWKKKNVETYRQREHEHQETHNRATFFVRPAAPR